MGLKIFTGIMLFVPGFIFGQETTPAAKKITDFKGSKLLYKDDFSKGMDCWVVETPQAEKSGIRIENGQLVMDVRTGATVWFHKKLSGNIWIECRRKVVLDSGKNDRLSDLNMFWMAVDPRNKNLFTRAGVFKEYDSLLLYYVGMGGNDNTTTRFRKYNGRGERILHLEHLDQKHLLQPNKEYHIKIIVLNGTTSVLVDNEEYFSFKDTEPIKEGYFGFRLVGSRQVVDDFKVYQLK